MTNTNAQLIRKAGLTAPRRLAVRYLDEELTYGDLYERSCRLVNALNGLGLCRQDRIAILGPNSIRTVELITGLALGGFIRVPLQYGNTSERHLDMLRQSEARLLVVDQQSLAEFGHRLAELGEPPRVVIEGSEEYERLLSAASAEDHQWPVDPADVAQIVFTGGTTGFSVGTTQTHQGFFDHTVENLVALPTLDEDDTFLVCTGLAGAPSAYLFPAISRYLRIVILPSFDAGNVIEAVASERVSLTVMLPGMLQEVLDHPLAASADLSSLRAVFVVGTPMSERTVRQTFSRLGDVLFFGYGATECAPVSMLTPRDVRRGIEGRPSLLRSVGRVMPRGDVRFVDAEGAVVRAGTLGEAQVRAAGQMRGYWNDAERTADKFTEDGWVRTGDVGFLDRDGYVYINGRLSDLIRLPSGPLHPTEVENAIADDRDVTEVCVFARIADHTGTLELHTVIYVSAGIDRSRVRSTLARGAAIAYDLRVIAFSPVPLPKSAAGKILRHEVASLELEWEYGISVP